MRTRSPALSDSMSASLSGGATSLMPSAPAEIIARSQCHFLVSVGMTLDGDRHRQRGDVTRVRQQVDAQGGGVTAVALRTDPEPVGLVEHLALDRVQRRIRIRAAQLAEERLLAEARGLLE